MGESTKKLVSVVTIIAVGLKIFWITGNDKVEFSEVFLFVFFFLMVWGLVAILFIGIFQTYDDRANKIVIYSAAFCAFFAACEMMTPSYDGYISSDECRSTIHTESCG